MTNLKENTGWADAMDKILVTKKPKKNKTIILSKAKKLSLMKVKTNEENENNESKANLLKELQKKNEMFLKGRKKPNILERDRERKLQKITVKGVVKLFNAVNKHQLNVKNNEDSVSDGTMITKKEKLMNSVSKSRFLSYLMGDDIKNEVEEINEDKEMDDQIKDEVEEGMSEDGDGQSKTWEVLSNDYGIGVKMKNWNQQNV